VTGTDKVADILRALGRHLLEWRASGKGSWRKDGSQYKADADARADEFLRRELVQLDRSIPIISEEDPASHTSRRPDLYWIIDPLDGTASFVEGFPGFVTQVALVEHHRPVLACVFAPVTDELFCAASGRGATRNGLALTADPSSRVVIDNYRIPSPIVRHAMTAVGSGQYVESGSIGLKMCRVADRTAGLFFKDVVVRDWDVAPGALILEEAAGSISSLDGTPFVFEGSYEKPGLVAASCEELLRSFVDWHSHAGRDAAKSDTRL